jgi:glutathione S-transferase
VKLYSGPLSLFTAKVRIALDEKGLGYERVEVGWSLAHRYEPHHPDVVALNPKQQVPVLVDGDVVVYDSTLILEYLEERHPQPPLFPSGAAQRARCRQLEAAADEILFPAVWDLIEESFYPAPAERRDAQRLAKARARLLDLQDGLEKELAGRKHLCERFSVADIATFVMLSAAANLGQPPAPGHANLRRWQEGVAARPAVRRELDGMNAYLRQALAPAEGDG